MKPEDIRTHIRAASTIALSLIEELARKIVMRIGGKSHFVMAMGGAAFYDKHGKSTTDYVGGHVPAWQKPVMDIIDEYDRELHLTGCPMWISADGSKKTDW